MVAAVRKEDLRKVPGVAETLDWAATLAGLDVHDLRQEPEAVHETLICLLKTHEDRARADPRGERAPARQGGVSVDARRARPSASRPSTEPRRRPMRAGGSPALPRTLRDNGFTVGLAETRDALAILASPAAARPDVAASRRCARCSARPIPTGSASTRSSMPSGAARGMRQRAGLGGHAERAPRRRRGGLPQAPAPQDALGLPDRVERRSDGDGERRRDGRGRREGASRAEKLVDDRSPPHRRSATRSRRRTRSPSGSPARCARGWCAASRSRRRGRRLDLRRTIHRSVSHGGTPIDLAWRRRKIKPLRLVVLLDASGSMSLYTAFFVRFLHGVVDAFREAEAFVFHTRLAHVSPSLRERDVDARGRQARADGAGHRRRHAHRREPRDVQSLARARA